MPSYLSGPMSYILERGVELFGQDVSYQRSGYTAFTIKGVPDIIPRLENADRGKFYGIKFRLADFENATFAASVVAEFGGIPTNDSRLIFDGVTYTFKTVFDNDVPYQVAKGSTAVEAARNLTAAINADPDWSALVYSSSTTAHTTCTAVQDSHLCRVSYFETGVVGNGKIATDLASGVNLDSKVFTGGGPLKADKVTFDGLTYNVTDIGYDGEGGVQLRLELVTL